MTLRKLLLILIAFAFFTGLVQAQGADVLAQTAKKILQTHCYRCHGENGSVEGGVNYMLDRNQLVSRGKVKPKEAMKSRIIKRILLEEMPPDGEKTRPNAAELATLKDWIAAGAPDFNPVLAKREFITHAATLAAVRNDLSKLSEQEQRFTRYFTFTHLHNANLSDDELATYRHGLSKLVNSLSWGKKIVQPKAIDAAQSILRIDLRDYKWSPRTWETLEAHYPYGLLVNTADELACLTGTGARLPFLRGDWFVASAALPPLYHDLLGMPTTDRQLEKDLRVSLLENLRDGEAMRAGFNASGVSRNNRLIERHPSLFGAYWKSYDFGGNTDRQNLFASPLGPGVRVTHFKHDGGEIIFSLPNGLQGYMLVDAKGVRIDKGPTEIVSDPRRPDRSVVNGLSCMSCHARGIIVKDDQVRPHVEKNRQAFLKDELEQILLLYPTRQRMQKAMEDDAARFREAVEKTGCRLGATEPIAALTQRFESEIDLNHAACELGLPAAQLQKRFEKSVTLGRLMGPLAIEGGTVQRDVFTDAYAKVVQDLELGKAMPRERHSQFLWTAPSRTPSGTPPKFTPPETKLTPPDPRFKPKPHRIYAGTPSSSYEDPLCFRISTHPTGQIHAVAVSPKEKWITAFEATPGIITLFHRIDHSNWASMAGHKGNVLALDFSHDGSLLASGSIDQTARIWDAETGLERHTLEGHAGFVRAVRFSPDKQWLATGSERVRLWSVATGAEKAAFAKTPGWIDSLAFSGDGQVIASASKVVQLWDGSSGKLINELSDHQGSAHCVAFAPDGKLLAYGTSEGMIHLWDRETSKVRVILKGHQQPVTSLAFNCKGTLLVSGSKPMDVKQNAEFKAWDPATGTELIAQAGHKAGIASIAVSPDGCYAVSAGLDGHLRYRDLMFLNKVPLGPFEGHFMPISGALLSKDGQLAATWSADRTVRLWNARSGVQIQRLEHSMPVQGVAFTSDGKHLFSGSADKTMRKWSVATGKVVQQWQFPSAIMDIVQSADQKTIAVVAGRDFVRVMDIATGKTIRDVKGPEQVVALSANGRLLAGAVFQKGMHIWEVASGKETVSIGNSKTVFSASMFSPDGKHLLTGDRDNAVCLWDIETGQEVLRYKGCTKEVRSVAFADRGRKVLASCGALKIPVVGPRQENVGCAVILWDAAGKELYRWDTHPIIVNRVAISSVESAALFINHQGVKRVSLP